VEAQVKPAPSADSSRTHQLTKPEPIEETLPQYSESEKSKGKMKEHPIEDVVTKADPEKDGDTKMKSPPSSPAMTRSSFRGHSPPRGPRNAPRHPSYPKIPTAPSASLQLSTKPDWNRRRIHVAQDVKPSEPEVPLPVIPVYKPKPLTPDLDAEVLSNNHPST